MFFKRLFLLLSCMVLLQACASYTEETREIRSLYRSDSYKSALEKLEKSSLKDDAKNRLLYQLEKAMILDRMGEGAKARALLIEADKTADALYTTSIARTAASLVVSESSTDYGGEDFEKVAIHTQMALSFIGDGDLAAARVQAKKINTKLAELNQHYDEHKNEYAEDAFALYLAGMIYEARGEYDDAIIDYGKAVELYSGSYARFVQGGVPEALIHAYHRLLDRRNRSDKLALLEKKFPKETTAARKEAESLKEAGEIAVIHELGHIAIKTTQEFVMGIGKQIVRFSWPVIRKRSQAYAGQTGLTVDGAGGFSGADHVQDMDEIARQCLEDRRLRMVAKQTARLLAKGQITEQAYKNFGPLGGIAANVFSAVTETADTRSWTLLPEGYYVSRVRLRPGKYTVRVSTGGRMGRIETVDVKKDQLILMRDFH